MEKVDWYKKKAVEEAANTMFKYASLYSSKPWSDEQTQKRSELDDKLLTVLDKLSIEDLNFITKYFEQY